MRFPAAAVAAAGFFSSKLAIAVAGGAPLADLARLPVSFLEDALLLLPLLALDVAAARVTRARRALRAAGVVVGVLLALWCAVNVYFVVTFGTPVTVALLAYAGDADVAGHASLVPLAIALAAVAGAAAAGVIGARREWPLKGAAAGVAVAVALGIVGRASGSALSSENAVVAFARSAFPAERAPVERRIAWDAPWPAPAQPALRVNSEERPRHVVIWLAESVGARFTQPYGAEARATPRLAEIAEHAVVVDNWYSTSPVSAKAIFSTLCGLHPLPEARFESRVIPRIACPSLMESLTRRGWRAGLFHGGYFAFTDKLAFLGERGFDVAVDGESVPDRERWFTNGWGVDDAAIVDTGLAWLDESPSTPSLAVYIPLVPHYEYWLPPGAPEPFGDATLIDRYRNGVAYTDALFGRVFDAYRERGIVDDTLFVFLGDHGEAFEEHARNKLHAGALYEENVKVAAVFASTRLFPSQVRARRLMTHVDLLPTVLDFVGAPLPSGIQGASLLREAPYRPALLQTYYPDALLGLRDGDWKYIRRADGGREELYDLARDPGERHDVSRAFPVVSAQYRARIADFSERQRRFLLEYPTLGPPFLERVHASLTSTAPVELVRDRVFNMERNCLRAKAPPPGQPPLVVSSSPSSPPAGTLGIGLTDRARFAKGEPVTARFTVGDESFELVVNDAFESTSRVRTLTAPSSSWRLEIAPAAGRERSVCIMVAP